MRCARRSAQVPVGLVGTLAAALMLTLLSLPSPAVGQGTKDPLDAMGVHRPAEPFPAPDLAFLTVEGHQARLSELRGKVVLLGFFTAT